MLLISRKFLDCIVYFQEVALLIPPGSSEGGWGQDNSAFQWFCPQMLGEGNCTTNIVAKLPPLCTQPGDTVVQ